MLGPNIPCSDLGCCCSPAALATGLPLLRQRVEPIRASHERAGEILAAAKLAHANSGIDKPFTVSVWEHYDEALLRGDDPRLDVWRSWGVDRAILLMFKSVDFDALNRAAKFLN